MLALPHSPQLEEAKTWRVSWVKSTDTAGARKTFTTFRPLFRGYGLIARTSFLRLISPSETRKPAANSPSCPGVRIVTLTGRVSTRISSGSSTASSSSAFCDLPSERQRKTCLMFGVKMVEGSLTETTGLPRNAGRSKREIAHALKSPSLDSAAAAVRNPLRLSRRASPPSRARCSPARPRRDRSRRGG